MVIDIKDRVKNVDLQGKIVTAYDAAQLINPNDKVGISGFTPSGYAKVVPLALAERMEKEPFKIDLWTGASVGDEADGALTRANGINRRFPYQTNKDMRKALNSGDVKYIDMHLSTMAQNIRYGFFGDLDVAIIEVCQINEDGSLVPTTSVGNSPTFVSQAKKVIVEVNVSQPLSLVGMHDIYEPLDPPHRKPIPLEQAGDRIGTEAIPCDPSKIIAVVPSDVPDTTRPLAAIDDDAKAMSQHLIKFFEQEIAEGRLPKNLLPLQSGVGSVANAVISGLAQGPFTDLSIYTEDSVKNLQFVIDMIQRELPKSMQDTVDQYEVELTKALTKLQLKSQVNVNYIDNSKLTATASSYQHDGSDPKNVLDDNPSTMWHTDWNLSTPHWIAFENKEEMSVNGLTYVPRQTGKNGNVTKYRIETSDDGINWKTVKEGNLSSDSSTKVIEFDTVKTKHLRLYYVEAVNNNGSAAEIKLHRADIPADVDGLKDVINKAKAMEDIGYLSTSWNHLQDTIKAAEGLVNAENPDANEIEIMKRQLTDAMVKLVLSVDNEQLKSFVDDLSNLEQKDYTKDSWKQFQTVLKEAQDVISNHDATKDEINDMYQKLLDAYNGLVTLNDKSGLTDLISKADQLQEKDYTKDSWKQLVEALTQAKEVSAKEDATKEEINEAIFNLEKTMNALKKVDSSTKDDNTSKGNTSSKDNQVITSTTKNDKKQSSTAKTGDETNIILFVLMAFMSWLGIKKVKKEEL